jgi:hypothetical protein
LAGLLSIGLVGAWLWTRKDKKQPTRAELDGERRETVYEVDGYVKPSEMEAKEIQAERAAPPVYEMSSEQESRKDP